MMAVTDHISIKVTGKGGHGAHADLAVDPALVAAHIITVVQSIVSSNVGTIDSAVVGLCAIPAGTMDACSVVPARATLVGTVHSFSAELRDLDEKRLHEVCSGVALRLGASAHVNYGRIYPATITSAGQARFAADESQDLVGHEHANRHIGSSMGTEDFFSSCR
jgi:hippurate hydrolase